jgi:hypothetical protein
LLELIKPVGRTSLELQPDPPLTQRPFEDVFVAVICGSMLCRLRVWTEGEWADLTDTERPTWFIYAPGLGWVGADPDCSQN